MSKLCSILLPTFRRPDSLRRAVKSFMGTAARESFDVWLYIHDSDPETLAMAPGLREYVDIRHIVGPDLEGYASCPLFVRHLAAQTDSPWLWLWADDVLIEGSGWDKQLAEVPPNEKWIAFAEVHKLASPPYNVTNVIAGYAYTFPIMPRSFEIPKVGSIDGLINTEFIPHQGWKPWILKGITANHQNTAPSWR